MATQAIIYLLAWQ